MDGSALSFVAHGAAIQHFEVHGIDIVLGFPTAELYDTHNTPHFGETIGRVANRVAGAVLRVPGGLNGRDALPLAANNGPNSLHGGVRGWGKQTWDGPTLVGAQHTQTAGGGGGGGGGGGAVVPGLEPSALASGGESVRFTLVSPDGDEGYPGTVRASVTYSAGKQPLPAHGGAEATVLVVEYEAELVDGADETVINMTNHSYFNLGNAPTIEGTVVELGSTHYLPVDAGGIPTGGPQPFAKLPGTAPFTLGAAEPDVDDCFVVDPDQPPAAVPLDTRGRPLARHLAAHHPATGLHLEVFSTEPAFQFYTGKYIDVPAVAGAPARGPRSGFCVEPSRFVNAPNVAAWKDMVLLKKGATYGARIVYRAWREEDKK